MLPPESLIGGPTLSRDSLRYASRDARSIRLNPGGTAMDRRERARTIAVVVALALLPIFSANLPAQEEGGHHAAPEEGGHHANHAGFFLGVTRVEGHSSFTVGADYEGLLPVWDGRLAAGALLDAAIGSESQHVILAGTLSLRPVKALKLLAGPGLEFAGGHSEMLFRAGAAVDLAHIGPLTVSPGAYFDFVGGHVATVLGFTFGTGFSTCACPPRGSGGGQHGSRP